MQSAFTKTYPLVFIGGLSKSIPYRDRLISILKTLCPLAIVQCGSKDPVEGAIQLAKES